MKNPEVPFGYEKGGKIYLSAWLSYPDREIGDIRENDIEKSSAFFIDRFNVLEKKVNEVIEKINETENKGSFLMKLLHLKKQLPEHAGLGDYLKLHECLSKYESLVQEIVQKNRARNSEIKATLIEEAKLATEEISWKEATEKVNDLKTRWIKTGNAEEEKNKILEQEFWDIIKTFFDRKKNFYEDKQKLLEVRKRQYEELVVEAEKTKELYGKVKFDRIKELKSEWKNIGGIPSELFSPLVQQFNLHFKPQSNIPATDYTATLKSLERIKLGEAEFDKQALDRIKKSVFRDKARNPDKGIVLEYIQLLIERDFVAKLAAKRFPDFVNLDAEKKKNIRAGIIKDLMMRDKDELKVYEENSSNFSSTDGKMNKIVEGKLKSQNRKIAVKEKLLEWVENDEF